MGVIHIAGAYGNSYSNIVRAKNAWDNNNDFKILGGPYINKEDWVNYSNKDTVVYEGSTAVCVLEEGKCL